MNIPRFFRAEIKRCYEMATKSTRTAKKTKKGGTVKNKKTTTAKKRSPETKPQSGKYAYLGAGVWMMIAAVLLAIFTYGAQGVVSEFIRDALFGLFSVCAYMVPPVCFALGIYVFYVKRTDKLAVKTALSAAGLVLISCLIMLFYKGDYPLISMLWGYGIEGVGGGVLGGTLAILLSKLVGRAASTVIVLVSIAVVLGVIFRVSLSLIHI